MSHNMPQNPRLPASNLRQRCRLAPLEERRFRNAAGTWRLSSGSIERRANGAAPKPGPSGSPSARGARMSASCALAAHVRHQRIRHAPACRPLGSRPKLVSQKRKRNLVEPGRGGVVLSCGYDTVKHLIMVAVSCGHGSPPCTCIQGTKKSTPHPSCQDRQLELVAAATQRRPPTSMNCATSSTTHLSLHTTGMQQLSKKTTSCNCGSSAVSSTSALESCRTAQQGHRPPCSQANHSKLLALPQFAVRDKEEIAQGL